MLASKGPRTRRAGCTEILDLAGYIDPDLATWIVTYSHVTTTLNARP